MGTCLSCASTPTSTSASTSKHHSPSLPYKKKHQNRPPHLQSSATPQSRTHSRVPSHSQSNQPYTTFYANPHHPHHTHQQKKYTERSDGNTVKNDERTHDSQNSKELIDSRYMALPTSICRYYHENQASPEGSPNHSHSHSHTHRHKKYSSLSECSSVHTHDDEVDLNGTDGKKSLTDKFNDLIRSHTDSRVDEYHRDERRRSHSRNHSYDYDLHGKSLLRGVDYRHHGDGDGGIHHRRRGSSLDHSYSTPSFSTQYPYDTHERTAFSMLRSLNQSSSSSSSSSPYQSSIYPSPSQGDSTPTQTPSSRPHRIDDRAAYGSPPVNMTRSNRFMSIASSTKQHDGEGDGDGDAEHDNESDEVDPHGHSHSNSNLSSPHGYHDYHESTRNYHPYHDRHQQQEPHGLSRRQRRQALRSSIHRSPFRNNGMLNSSSSSKKPAVSYETMMNNYKMRLTPTQQYHHHHDHDNGSDTESENGIRKYHPNRSYISYHHSDVPPVQYADSRGTNARYESDENDEEYDEREY